MENQNDIVKDIYAPQKRTPRNDRLSTIALIFGFAPVILWLLGHLSYYIFHLLSYVFFALFFISVWGIGFQVIGLVLGIVSLFRREKGRMKELIFSIVAILAPFIWSTFTWWLYNHAGVEIYL